MAASKTSKGRVVRKGCPTRKFRYKDEVAAMFALATLQRQDKPQHSECRTYLCPRCSGWHLTSKR